jgi:U4/U6 small nuclear ribonucleoprotein PRP4
MGTSETPVLGPLSGLEGHELKVNRVAVHPHHPQFVFSTSDDETWRMWDVVKQQELLLQEGHVAPVFGIAVHPDGSLVATSDTAGVIRVWDIRTGRSVLGFEGQHADQVIGLDFSPSGYSLASCSGDNTVRIWDLREKRNIEILSAHEKLVSCVKFAGQRGDVLMTAGYDCVARVWRTNDFKNVKNLPIHETRIMAADIRADGKAIATACYDRTFKIWQNPSKQDVKMEV